MKTKTSAGLAIIYDNKILLAHTTSRGWYGSYGIPKGGIDKGESKLDAAIREAEANPQDVEFLTNEDF